jgi:hypothetical protein
VATINNINAIGTDPPAGLPLISAGASTTEDTLDAESDAIPTNLYVSAF